MCKNNKEVKSDRRRKIIRVAGMVTGTIAVAGLTGYIVYKKCSNKPVDNETELLRDVVLEAGVFDAAISNLARRIDNKRCEFNRYLRGCNVDQKVVNKFETEIAQLEKTLAYAVERKNNMIKD